MAKANSESTTLVNRRSLLSSLASAPLIPVAAAVVSSGSTAQASEANNGIRPSYLMDFIADYNAALSKYDEISQQIEVARESIPESARPWSFSLPTETGEEIKITNEWEVFEHFSPEVRGALSHRNLPALLDVRRRQCEAEKRLYAQKIAHIEAKMEAGLVDLEAQAEFTYRALEDAAAGVRHESPTSTVEAVTLLEFMNKHRDQDDEDEIEACRWNTQHARCLALLSQSGGA